MLGHLPSGIVEVNEEPIIPEFGEHLVMVPVHVAWKGGRMLLTPVSRPPPPPPGLEACLQLSQGSEPRAPGCFPQLVGTVQGGRGELSEHTDPPRACRLSEVLSKEGSI